MGLDITVASTEDVLIQLVESLPEYHPGGNAARMFAIEQIKKKDYTGAGVTITLAFPPAGDFWDDIPKLLVELSKPPACNCDTLLSTLYKIRDSILEAEASPRLRQCVEDYGYTWFGAYRSVHEFRMFVTSVVKDWRQHAVPLTPDSIIRYIEDVAAASPNCDYDYDVCSNLTNHSDCDGYYFPFYAKEPINHMFGSLYGLAEELIEFYNTGAVHALLKMLDKRSQFPLALQERVQVMLDRYAILVQYAGSAIDFDDVIVFC